MPGEKPTTIWRPSRRKRQPAWLRAHPGRFLPPAIPLLRWIGVAALITLSLWTWRSTATHVVVVVNGQPVAVATHRTTVAGAVRLAGVKLDETLYIEPPADTPLAEGMVITLGRLRPVTIHADGQRLTASTHEIDPRAIAAGAGIALAPQDAVIVVRAMRPTAAEIAAQPALGDVPPLPRELRVVRPQQIIVHEIDLLSGAQIDVSFMTTETSLGRALMLAGYAIYEADRVTPGLETPVEAPLDVTIERATPVTLHADGLARELRTHTRTVGDLLAEAGLALSGQDYSLPEPAAPLRSGLSVEVVRVSVEEVIDETPIPFETVYVPDPDMILDQQRTVEAGEPGVLARQSRIRRENGVTVGEVVVGEWVMQPPRAEVIAYGTRILIHTLETPYGPLEYWRKLHVLATSYSPSTAGHKQPGDPFFGVSATGAEVVRGIIATDPRVIALGANLYVPDYGIGRALDVGGAVKGFRIDLGYDDANLVLWNTWVDVYLLLPIPPPDEMIWVLPG